MFWQYINTICITSRTDNKSQGSVRITQDLNYHPREPRLYEYQITGPDYLIRRITCHADSFVGLNGEMSQ